MSDGTRVPSQRYLADTTAAADAVSAFTDVLAGLGPEARRGELIGVAPRLAEARDRAGAIADRLGAQRLEDVRLEAQRQEAAGALAPVVAAMDLLVTAAERGNPTGFESASQRYAARVGELVAVGD